MNQIETVNELYDAVKWFIKFESTCISYLKNNTTNASRFKDMKYEGTKNNNYFCRYWNAIGRKEMEIKIKIHHVEHIKSEQIDSILDFQR